jgi:hypothetical protein
MDTLEEHKPPSTSREYVKHGDTTRRRQARERARKAVNGRTKEGKEAKRWRAYMLAEKGGKEAPLPIRRKIETAMFYLWRALCLESYIVADSRKRGTIMNRRSGKLPKVNEQYDAAMAMFLRIEAELEQYKKPTELDRL